MCFHGNVSPVTPALAPGASEGLPPVIWVVTFLGPLGLQVIDTPDTVLGGAWERGYLNGDNELSLAGLGVWERDQSRNESKSPSSVSYYSSC